MKIKVTAFPSTSHPDIIRSANSKRNWMDVASAKNPYRCLPLSMANSWGWEILSSAKFTATWDGKDTSPSGVKITVHEGKNPPSPHFGEGTLTWHTGYVFKTEYPYGLYVTGAPNYPKPNVIPLSGVVETHWLTYTFTMNWRFTQPGSFTMDIGEPFCQIFPIDMTTFDNTLPEIKSMTDDMEFHDLYWDWNVSRANYMTERKIPTSPVYSPDVWQRHYFQGKYPPGKVHPEGAKCPIHINADGEKESVHRTKPNVPEFVDVQTTPFVTIADYNERRQEALDKYEEYRKSIESKKVTYEPPKVIHRSPEEVEERIRYYEQVLRQYDLNKLSKSETKKVYTSNEFANIKLS